MLFKHIKAHSGLVGYLMLSFIFLSGAGFAYLKWTHQLTPGALSNYHQNGPLGGVASHADLATRCTHCHVPIHCLEDDTCQDCHIDIARDRADVTTLHGKLPDVSRCQNCHPEHRGAEADLVNVAFHNFDHYALVGYSLAGHAENFDGSEMTCDSCHFESGDIAESLDCAGCHAEEDHAAMAAHVQEYGSRCIECHDGKDRMMSTFDHAPYLPLEGGHADLACSDCHGVRYDGGIDADCKTCHADPEIHLGEFGLDCVRCHSADAWTPATLKIHIFELTHGDETGDDCTACHVSTYAEYTCAPCHTDEEMHLSHILYAAPDIQNCIACHPTGRPDEASPYPMSGDVVSSDHTHQNQNGMSVNARQNTTDKTGKDGSK